MHTGAGAVVFVVRLAHVVAEFVRQRFFAAEIGVVVALVEVGAIGDDRVSERLVCLDDAGLITADQPGDTAARVLGRAERTHQRDQVGAGFVPRFTKCRESRRSEEQTSELQSLMRISYAVFCLKKNKYTNNTPTQKPY